MVSTTAQEAPHWFYHPPQSSHLVYGASVAPKYLNDSLAIAHARLSAIASISRQFSVRVESKHAEVERGAHSMSYGYTIEQIDSTVYRQCLSSAVGVDSAITRDHVFYLAAIRKDRTTPKQSWAVNSQIVNPDRKSPEWVQTTPSGGQHIYGMGVSEPYRLDGDAWYQSAKNARGAVAFQISVKKQLFREEAMSESSVHHRKLSEDQSEVWLQGAIIKDRWYDAEDRMYYSLIEYHLPSKQQ